VEPLFRPTAEELVDELAPLGEADLQATFAKKYPMRIITRLLGIPRRRSKANATASAPAGNRSCPDVSLAARHTVSAASDPVVTAAGKENRHPR
jgi:cytochrome P450